ncbi:DUF7564 family protein [Halogeometricum limi]
MKRIPPLLCVDCGEPYSFTNTYKGNYCGDCHSDWAARPSRARSRPRLRFRSPPAPAPRPLRSQTTPSVRRLEDEDAGSVRYRDE